MSEYTKGPWEAIPGADNENGVTRNIGIMADGWHIARVWDDGPNSEADSHLIAAAPDLLESLKELLEHLDGNCVTEGDCNQARAAIAKAEGKNA